ncbi:MAG: hypothetical protein V8Q30_05460 [Acutalibacteraceae bacterium]
MGAGLIAGMGYLAAALSLRSSGRGSILYTAWISGKKAALYKTLHITIPEDLDYTGVFDDLFSRYTASCELIRSRPPTWAACSG